MIERGSITLIKSEAIEKSIYRAIHQARKFSHYTEHLCFLNFNSYTILADIRRWFLYNIYKFI